MCQMGPEVWFIIEVKKKERLSWSGFVEKTLSVFLP